MTNDEILIAELVEEDEEEEDMNLTELAVKNFEQVTGECFFAEEHNYEF